MIVYKEKAPKDIKARVDEAVREMVAAQRLLFEGANGPACAALSRGVNAALKARKLLKLKVESDAPRG